MATLRELSPKVGDRFKATNVKQFIVDRVSGNRAIGTTHWLIGSVREGDWWPLDAGDKWERIEPDTDAEPEAVTEPPQHVYAYLAAQYGIVIIADGVTYDGTKQ